MRAICCTSVTTVTTVTAVATVARAGVVNFKLVIMLHDFVPCFALILPCLFSHVTFYQPDMPFIDGNDSTNDILMLTMHDHP